MFLSDKVITVYSTVTGQLVRNLEGATAPLIDFALELTNDDTVVACSKSGEILTWLWKTGQLKSTVNIQGFLISKTLIVTNFKLLNLYGTSQLSYAFVCMKIANETIQWCVIDRTTGKYVEVNCDLYLA